MRKDKALAESMLKQARIMTPKPNIPNLAGEDAGRIHEEGLIGKPVYVLAKFELPPFVEMLCVYDYDDDKPWSRTTSFLDFFTTRAQRIRDEVGNYQNYKLTAYPQQLTEEIVCSHRTLDKMFENYSITLIREEFLMDMATSNQEAKKLLTKFKGDM